MQVIVDGLLTNYLTAGSGRTVVLVHGWGDSLDTYKQLIKSLSRHYQVVALDLPGFGGSQLPDEAWSLDDYARFMAHFLKKIDITKTHALIGHSFGGSVLVVGLGGGQLKTDKLVLIASSGVRGERSLKQRAYLPIAKIVKLPLFLLPPSKATKIKTKLYGRIGSDFLLIPHMRSTYLKIINQDVRSDAAKISKPALLIYGEKDKETPPSMGRLLSASIKNSRLEVIRDSGHYVHHDEAAKLNSLIEEFLR